MEENHNHIIHKYAIVTTEDRRYEYVASQNLVIHPHISFSFLSLIPVDSAALFGGFLQISDELQCLVLPSGNVVEPSKMDFVDI